MPEFKATFLQDNYFSLKMGDYSGDTFCGGGGEKSKN